MIKNMGSGDRIFRFVLGLVIIVMGIYFKSWWGVLGLIPLLTAVISWCPLYVPFKISTKRSEIHNN